MTNKSIAKGTQCTRQSLTPMTTNQHFKLKAYTYMYKAIFVKLKVILELRQPQAITTNLGSPLITFNMIKDYQQIMNKSNKRCGKQLQGITQAIMSSRNYSGISVLAWLDKSDIYKYYYERGIENQLFFASNTMCKMLVWVCLR